MSRGSIHNNLQTIAAIWAALAISASIPCLLQAADAKAPGTTKLLEAPPKLSLPISCDLGKSCFIQNYVDNDPGPDAHDYTCGTATYDNHKGTDFRLLSAASATRNSVHVLAAAPGMIKSIRNSMPDRLMTRSNDARQNDPRIRGRECGNGVVIDHGNGWETQYCHLLRGSIHLKKGQQVNRGTPIGRVGYSGMAAFAHVHLSVRHNDRVIDPFTGMERATPCTKPKSLKNSLWNATAQQRLTYSSTTVIDAGFTGDTVKPRALEADHQLVEFDTKSRALVVFARLINMRQGDQLTLSIVGPKGFKFQNVSKPLAKNKASQTYYAGKKRKLPQWPAGPYVAEFKVTNEGKVVALETRTVTLPR